jgi:hypothetical protein
LSCRRCGAPLLPGRGDYYHITIEAVADPSGPSLATDEPAGEVRRRIEQLLSRLENLSEQELMDQIWRRLSFHLCLGCYRQWIDAPTGW